MLVMAFTTPFPAGRLQVALGLSRAGDSNPLRLSGSQECSHKHLHGMWSRQGDLNPSLNLGKVVSRPSRP